MMFKMHVSDIMATHVQTVNRAESAEQAWHVLRQRNIHHLVVKQREPSLACSRPAIWVDRVVRCFGSVGVWRS